MSDIKSVSYSQFSQWVQCPWKWKLNYVDDMREFHGNIFTLFGSAAHEVIQEYLTIMYTKTAKDADALDLNAMLLASMKEQFIDITKSSSGVEPCTQDEMVEFYYDGVTILDYLKKNRNKYFSKRGYELLGVEIELKHQVSDHISFRGFIDIAIKDTLRNRIKIIDIKTSTVGWNKWMKQDKVKSDQLLLYKQFYSKQYNVPLNSIDVEFFIVKRKLYEKVDFPQKRIQIFAPANGTPSINKTMIQFNSFLDDAFIDGEYKTTGTYRKEPSAKNCKWC
jgi:hypothetical protein